MECVVGQSDDYIQGGQIHNVDSLALCIIKAMGGDCGFWKVKVSQQNV